MLDQTERREDARLRTSTSGASAGGAAAALRDKQERRHGLTRLGVARWRPSAERPFVFDHEGAGDVIENDLTGGAYRVIVERAPAGEGPPMRIHPHTDEDFYIGE
jgi:hypothetical protein